jgi:hypothetical protein
MLIGTEGVYSYTFEHEKRADCPVCGGESLEISIPGDWTVEQLIEMLVEKQDVYVSAIRFLSPICASDAHLAKLRGHRCRRQRNLSTSKRHRNLRQPRAQTWKKGCRSWCQRGGM